MTHNYNPSAAVAPRLTWEYYLDEVSAINLSAEEQTSFIASIDLFRRLLGPLDRYSSPPIHPIVPLLSNRAPWTRRELTRWATAFRTLDGAENFSTLRADFANPDKAAHALLLALTCAPLVAAGLSARFEPTLPVSNHRRQPDARLTTTGGDTVFIEVSIQRMSGHDRETYECSENFWLLFFQFGHGKIFSGKIHRSVAQMHFVEIAASVAEAAQRIDSGSPFAFAEETGVYCAAFASDAGETLLAEWCSERGLAPGSLSGAPRPSDPVLRLKEKIRKEQAQLPVDACGVLVIDGLPLTFTLEHRQWLVTEIEDEVFKYPNLAMVAIQTSYIGGTPTTESYKGHRFTRRCYDIITADSLVLVNRFCSIPLTPSVRDRFLSSL